LVSNHLSYLDVLVLGALAPSVFVAKREVKNWPIFGWFARLAGTLFAHRELRTQVGPLTRRLRTMLEQGILVVLFPEGTSSDGRTILPFKSALLEPATDSSRPLSACLIAYRLEDGDVGEEVCYWKDMTFVPHLFNLLSKRRIEASLFFSGNLERNANRKDLARKLHSEVFKLKILPHDFVPELVGLIRNGSTSVRMLFSITSLLCSR
jgi:1-acyl-sn-glycerol-3-phosphate acyltransferase